MEMHQLKYLEAVARCGSIMGAATACHVSQPALSVQLKKLEEELGARLLVRTSRGASLTAAGERALVTARRILREAASLHNDARLRTFKRHSTLRVCIQPYVATEIIPRVFATLGGEELPGTRLEFRERPPARLLETVMSGGADLGVVDNSLALAGDLCAEELLRVPYCLFVHEEHPLASRAKVRLVHLLQHPLVHFEYCPTLRQRLQSLSMEREQELHIPFTTELAVTAFEMVAARRAASVLPASFAARAARRRMVAKPIEDYDETARISVIWREGLPPSSGAQAFIDRLREKLAPAHEA